MENKHSLQNHIQSLRAFSVLIVFLYHTNIDLFTNGYLGVDIFFLISGYVISKKIFENYNKTKKIDLKSFYLKRIKRILPNLIFIVLTTYVIIKFFGPANLPIFNETIYSLLGFSNLYYLNNSNDYFNNIFDNPLAHTWSLGVEEQFYIVFPILIYLCFKIKNNNFLLLKASVIIIFLLSLFFYIINYNTNPLYSFYFSPFRFWEFLMGTLFYLNRQKIKYNQILYVISIAIILFIIFANQDVIINYYKNVIILFFSGYIISSYKKNAIFEIKSIIYLGNISYSFYLWHLPVLFFLDLYVPYNIYIISLIAFILTVIFSSLTYRYIEENFRYIIWKLSHTIIILSTVTIVFLFLIYIKSYNEKIYTNISHFINNNNFIEKKFNWTNKADFEKRLKIGKSLVYDFCKEDSPNYTINDIGLREECLQHTDNSTIFFLFGNSHSVQFLPILNELKIVKNIYYNHYTGSFNINQINQTINILKSNYKEVYLTTNIDNLEGLEKIKKIYKKTKDNNVKLILFNSIPSTHWKLPFKCLIQNRDCFIDKIENIKIRNLTNQFNIIKNYQVNNEGDIFVFDSFNYLCNKNNKCKIYDKNNDKLFYRDNSHLTYDGAISLLDKFNSFLNVNEINEN